VELATTKETLSCRHYNRVWAPSNPDVLPRDVEQGTDTSWAENSYNSEYILKEAQAK